MQERDSFYLGALLHDIGKFIERAKLKEWCDLAYHYVETGDASSNYAHRRYSAAFIDKNREKKSLFPDSASETYSLWHHKGNESDKRDYESINNKGVLLKLIRIADNCASAERRDDATLEPQKYYLARLQSIFNEIIVKDENGVELKAPKPMYLELETLSCKKTAMFPLNESPAFDELRPLPYDAPVRQFFDAFKQIETPEELLFLLEKYLHAVPAQTPVEFNGIMRLSRPDINLFDHSRITAAIALCLYDEWKDGDWKGHDAEILNDTATGYQKEEFPHPCILIAADLSGIQDFIFNIPSKGAARSLKGRSFFVQLLSEVCAQFLLDELGLEPVNLLYNGGGNFFILAPACKGKLLDKCVKKISEVLLQSELSVTIAHVPVGLKNFSSFSERWDKVMNILEQQKKRKYQMLDAKLVFGLLPQKPRESEDPYGELTKLLAKSSGYSLHKTEKEVLDKGWPQLFSQLGYEVEFKEGLDALCFNNTDFEGKFKGFRFAVKSLPVWLHQKEVDDFKLLMEKGGCRLAEEDEENRKQDNVKTFNDLAGYACIATGTPKIGILKMDVDNLGRIFSDGLPDQLRTPSRIMALSRSLKWFFEGYMKTLIEKYEGQLYPIFSGGDDFFLVGAWDKVFELTLEIREAFDEFVAHHPGISLSASLLVVDEHFPVSRFAVLAEERLHEAKYGSLHKNTINVFGQNLTWEEFNKAKKIKDDIVRMVDDHVESKAVIQKILNACEGLDVLHERAVRFTKAKQVNNLRELKWFEEQKPTGEKVWRLAYYLRGLQNAESRSIAKNIVDSYEQVVFDAMRGLPVNPMYIAVGARWAELTKRKGLTIS